MSIFTKLASHFTEARGRQARQCPNGHTMDPNWTHCPYCQAERQANGEGAVNQRDRTRTRVEEEGSSTSFPLREADVAQPQASEQGDNNRIVGVLISYSRRREGEVFPIREGRNYIGSGTIDSFGAVCDICFPEDRSMSEKHALLLYRRGEYLIFDQQSTNGTFVNGKMVHFRGEELPNNAEIKAGSAAFRFIKAEAHAPGPVEKIDIR